MNVIAQYIRHSRVGIPLGVINVLLCAMGAEFSNMGGKYELAYSLSSDHQIPEAWKQLALFRYVTHKIRFRNERLDLVRFCLGRNPMLGGATKNGERRDFVRKLTGDPSNRGIFPYGDWR